MSGFIYAVSCMDFIKVGISTDVKSRLVKMRTDNPFNIEVEFILGVENHRQVEALSHKLLSEFLHKGEWFKCTKLAAIKAINTANNNVIKKEAIKNKNSKISEEQQRLMDEGYSFSQIVKIQQQKHLIFLVDFFGSQKITAYNLGVSKQVVSNWVVRGRISAKMAIKADNLTSGEIKKEDLRPDVLVWEK